MFLCYPQLTCFYCFPIMAKRKVRKTRKVKRRRSGKVKRRRSGKLLVKQKFYSAIKKLHRLKANQQRAAVSGASKEFLDDISKTLRRLKTVPHILSAKHKNTLKRHRQKLRRLVHAKTPTNTKRRILMQKGGFISILVPILSAIIAAAGGIGAAATSAAIIKS